MTSLAIFCDFDGTICIPDSSEYLLSRFGTKRWIELEEAVWRGELTERNSFPLQLETLSANWPEARAALHEGVRIREGFSDFVRSCRNRDIPFVILSSGLRLLIDELLGSIGLRDVPVFAHDVLVENGKWKFVPYNGDRFEEHCSHCKCVHLERARAQRKRVVYIGDGYTDICPSRRADVVFATDALARTMTNEGRNYFSYETFYDIERELDALIHADQEST
jgi:2,3-diketo-5-methylthio-1-phosphopentane phosphatase